jgi:predicted dehydrogenase
MNRRIMIRIGIVGTGAMAKERLRSFMQIADVCVVAVYARNSEKGHLLADETGITVYDNYRHMLAAVDAVAICLPNDLHAQFATEAMRAERHVLVEYPLATNLEDAMRLRSVSLAYKCVLMAGNTIIHESPFNYIRQHQSRLGELVSASSRVSFYSGEIIDGWFFDRQRLGPVFVGLHYHHIEYYKHLLGQPSWILGCDESVIDAASGRYGSFVGGTLVMGHLSRKTSCVQWYLSAAGSGLPRAMWLNGTCGSLTLLSLGNGTTEARWDEGAGDGNRDIIEENWGVDGSCKDFVMAVKGELDYKKRLADDTQTLRFAFAARDSAKSGRMVHLD